MGGNDAKEYPFEYLTASGVAASVNYPLWRASAIGQSGFHVGSINVAGQFRIPASMSPYVYAFVPPYKGAVATVGGMTWARAAIFWGSDYGRDVLKQRFNASDSVATVLPPLVVSTLVQIVNQPLVRATVTIQDPKAEVHNVRSALVEIYRSYGVAGLWHGTSAGIMKTVPKYCTAIIVKDFMEETLPRPDPASPTYKSESMWRSAYKSCAAGIAGAVLTNPLDVIRNEMFKTNDSLTHTIRKLHAETGYSYFVRGMDKNMIAVAIPVAMTIFFTDAFIEFSKNNR
jgi:Mitochondrial carrier protein